MQQIRALISLLEQGHSYRTIAAELKLSRQPVTSYAIRLKASAFTFEELRKLPDADLARIVYAVAAPDPSLETDRRKDFDTRVAYFIAELKRTGVTRLLLWQEYSREYSEPFKYTRFCILLKEASKTSNATMHLLHAPAAMVMADFAGDKMSYVDRTSGEIILCLVFIAVFPFSNYSFAIAVPDATIPQVVKALNACLKFFGGVPLSLKTDNMRQVVIKSCRYEPLFTEVLQQWAQHYDTTLLATRVLKPQDKGAVENEVKIAYQRIYAPLRDVVFHDIDDLNLAISKQLTLHNEKLFQLKDHSRLQLFEKEEKQLLRPLPDKPFEIKHKAEAKVQKNYHITLGENHHHYSVPYRYIGKKVNAVYDTDIVEIYHAYQRIALHRRSFKKHDFTTTAEHMPSGHQQYFEQQGWTPAYFLTQATRIGSAVHDYMDEVLKARAFTEQTYNACKGILRLHNQYGSQRLEAACRRALRGQVFNYRTIQNILIANHDLLTESFEEPQFRTPDHDNLRGAESYQ